MSAAESEPAEPVQATDLTAFQQELLAILADEGRDYGLGIKESLGDRYGETIHHGRLYPNLDDLIDLGLVEKEPFDKRTNEYFLTNAGKRFVCRHAQRWDDIADGLTIRGEQ